MGGFNRRRQFRLLRKIAHRAGPDGSSDLSISTVQWRPSRLISNETSLMEKMSDVLPGRRLFHSGERNVRVLYLGQRRHEGGWL